MASSNDFYASSPTVVLPPSNSNHYFSSSHYSDHGMNGFPFNGAQETTVANAISSAANGSLPPASASLAGRKRSRGDIHAPEEEDDPKEVAQSPDAADEMITDSQTARSVSVSPKRRPAFPCRKSQRTDSAAAGADNTLAQLVLPPDMREATAEPLIDEATRLLGISWTRMNATEALQINQAAYSKWISKHYSALESVSVWFENSAIPAYLVEATNAYSGQAGYYIFSHDLTEARLVTTEPAQLIPRLQMLPALHLAAPGGCLKAETDPITAFQNEVDGVQVAMSKSDVDSAVLKDSNSSHLNPPGVESHENQGMCAAHAMEVD